MQDDDAVSVKVMRMVVYEISRYAMRNSLVQPSKFIMTNYRLLISRQITEMLKKAESNVRNHLHQLAIVV